MHHLLATRKIRLLFLLGLILFGMWHKEIHQFFSPPAKPSTICQTREAALRQQLAEGATCTQDADCQPSPLNCPFRCGVALSKQADLTMLRAQVAHYIETCGACVEECSEQTVQCLEGRCIAQ